MPTVRPSFSAIFLLDSPPKTKDATCRRRLVNARNRLALSEKVFGRGEFTDGNVNAKCADLNLLSTHIFTVLAY